MHRMFVETYATELDLSSFNTSNVESMRSMFSTAKATEIKITEKFNTKKVTDMYNMFAYTQAPVIDVSAFDTSNVTNMMECLLQAK